jgi:hypothetical protein
MLRSIPHVVNQWRALSENMQGATSDGSSTRQRSFLGHYEVMPTNRRFPLPWSIEDNGAAFVVKAESQSELGRWRAEGEP